MDFIVWDIKKKKKGHRESSQYFPSSKREEIKNEEGQFMTDPLQQSRNESVACLSSQKQRDLRKTHRIIKYYLFPL